MNDKVKSKKELKKLTRPARKNSRCRVVSLNFPDQMSQVAEESGKSFIPNEDYMLLLRKYEWLVKRRRKELNRKQVD